MIQLDIKKGQDSRYKCVTDDQHLAVARWLQNDMGRTGGSGVAEELFEEIGAFRSGKKDHVEAWGDLVRVRINREGVIIQAMPSIGKPCTASLEELVDVVLRWFDVVNPELAGKLRKIQSTW